MALQIQHELSSGIICPEAYARINRVTATNGTVKELKTEMNIYYNHQAYVESKTPIQALVFNSTFNEGDDVSFASLYSFLKTLEDFIDAVDV